MRKIALLSLLLALVFFILLACTKKQEPTQQAKQVRISATSAYEKYFGPAPTTDKGTCYAFVIYFPSAKQPGTVVPFPFFTFDEKSVEKVAVERLLAGMDVAAYQAETTRPFAPEARLLALEQVDGLKRVDLSDGFLAPGADHDGMLHALVMTLAQFREVHGVRLLQAGKDLDYARGPQKPRDSWVQEPGPPRLLSVTAIKDKGAKNIEEVSAYFDRPVEVQELSMTDQKGNAFPGDMYHSVFDMAAVLKPKDPGVFKERMSIKVHWKVTDKLGRHGEGDNVWFLEVREH